MNEGELSRLSVPRVWFVPLAAALGALALYALGENQDAFFALNTLAPSTSAWLWANITVLGDTAVALTLCLPLWRRRPDLVWALAIGGILATAWVHVLKPTFDEPRPPAVLGAAVHVIGPAYQTKSFPSGHATTAFAVAGLLALGLKSRWWFVPLLLLAATVAMSRSVVGVHWPIDLLAGAFGGWFSAALGLALAKRFSIGLRSEVQTLMALAMAGCAVALLLGYDTGYPQAFWLQRAIAVACLAAAAVTWMGGATRRE